MIHSIKSHFKFLSVVKELFAARGGKPAGGRRKVRIGLEALEDRAVPAALGLWLVVLFSMMPTVTGSGILVRRLWRA